MSAFKSLAIIALAAFATAMPTANTGSKSSCTGTQAAATCGTNQQLECCQDGGLLGGLVCELLEELDLDLTETCPTGTVNCCSGDDTGLIVLDLRCAAVNLDLLTGLGI